jgi:hypothetical protein
VHAIGFVKVANVVRGTVTRIVNTNYTIFCITAMANAFSVQLLLKGYQKQV